MRQPNRRYTLRYHLRLLPSRAMETERLCDEVIDLTEGGGDNAVVVDQVGAQRGDVQGDAYVNRRAPRAHM